MKQGFVGFARIGLMASVGLYLWSLVARAICRRFLDDSAFEPFAPWPRGHRVLNQYLFVARLRRLFLYVIPVFLVLTFITVLPTFGSY